MSELSGKVCLVTGGAGGLGKAIAETLILATGKVVIVDINLERLKATETELSLHGDVLALAVDITDEDAVKGMLFATFEKFGHLDVVVNNAGITDVFDGVATLEKSMWDKVIAVNLTAPYLVSKHAVDHFLSREPSQGVIVNIASVGGLVGGRAGAAYTASKHGLIGLTKNTATQYAKQNIRCNAILPGMMQTNIAEAFAAGYNQAGMAIMQSTAAMDPGFVDLKKVAGLVKYLSSGDAAIVNGTTIAADNGWLAY